MNTRYKPRIRSVDLFRTMTILVLTIALSAPILAQTPQYSYTGGSGGNAIPWNPNLSSTWQKYQGFYGPNIFTGAYAGNITAVYWQRSQATSGTTYSNLTISLGQSTNGNFASNAYFTPVTQGFTQSSYTVPAGNAGQWFRIQLQTPVYYNPNNYLVVQICSNGVTAGTGFAVYDGGSMLTPSLGRIYGGGSGCATTSPSGSTTNYHQNFGFDMSPALPDDAGISNLISPVNFCAGTEDIIVNLKNFGTNTLNSVTINWSYDGVTQTPINYNTPLASLADATITLGTRTFTGGTSHDLVAWTSNPNSTQDSFTANDSLVAALKPALSGTFTIGGASPDYATFADALADLTVNGICGPVVFKVRSGTYSEQVDISNIPGASATNTVIFESETGNRTDVTVTHSSTSNTNNFVVAFNGCSYVTFRDMTLTATNGSYGTVLLLQGGALHNTMENCIMNGINTTSTSTYLAVVYSPSGTLDNYTTIRGCELNNGSSSMYMYGSGSTSGEIGDIIENNVMQNFHYAGMWMYYHDSPIVRGNTLVTSSTYTNYFMYIYYNYGPFQYVGNKLIANSTTGTKYGMMIYYYNGTSGNEGLVANNFIKISNGSSTVYGIYCYYSYYINFLFNTMYTDNTYSSSRLMYSYYGGPHDFVDNIMYNAGSGYTWYNYYTTWNTSDYNVFYANGTNLAYWNGSNKTDITSLRAANGMDANSISKSVNFVNAATGDLHLGSGSEDDAALVGTQRQEVTTDIDGEARILPYRGADEACYILPNSVTYELTDASGTQSPYTNVPGTFGVKYHVAFPDFAANITVTLNFYSIPNNVFTYTTSFNVTKQQGVTLDGLQLITINNIPPGVYRVETIFNTKNSCGGYRDYSPGDASFMILPQGSVPCIVWPGDVNNDGVVNYGDRKSLNTYIHDANLNPTWLTGPARYRADAATDPLTYVRWEAQAAVPWSTAEGCYMDADGNGVVNSFDYIPMKLNWMRLHSGSSPKGDNQFAPNTFDMSQNYPNPFNPTTQIRYSVPERSQVRIVVTNLLGQEVATLVNETVEAGVRTLTFDGSQFGSGTYIAVASMQGLESGLTFSKTVRMTLAK